jgi:hypothetical protein
MNFPAPGSTQLNSMALAYADELWVQLPRDGLYSRPIMDEARGMSEVDVGGPNGI